MQRYITPLWLQGIPLNLAVQPKIFRKLFCCCLRTRTYICTYQCICLCTIKQTMQFCVELVCVRELVCLFVISRSLALSICLSIYLSSLFRFHFRFERSLSLSLSGWVPLIFVCLCAALKLFNLSRVFCIHESFSQRFALHSVRFAAGAATLERYKQTEIRGKSVTQGI